MPCCPTQQPESFCERAIYELLEKELDNQHHSFNFRRRPDGERLLVEPLPIGRNLAASQKAFKKYFAERFGLENADTAFEDYLQTGLPKLPWQYVATAFKITPDDWDEDFLPPYLTWLMDTFSHASEKVPTFLFFILVVVKNAHRTDALHGGHRALLAQIEALKETCPDRASVLKPLPPVKAEDLEYWLEKNFDAGADLKQRVLELLAARLKGDEAVQYEAEQLLNMERVEAFLEKIYRTHK